MAVTYTNRSTTVGYGARLVAAFNSLVGSVLTWNDRRTTQKLVSKLSDRELEDIGLTRGDILDLPH